jgi:hypothetical protein
MSEARCSTSLADWPRTAVRSPRPLSAMCDRVTGAIATGSTGKQAQPPRTSRSFRAKASGWPA